MSRAVGSKNKVSKSLQAQEHYLSLVAPKISRLVEILVTIAESDLARDSDRIRAIDSLLGRALPKQQHIELTTDVRSDGTEQSPETLLQIFDAAPDVPDIDLIDESIIE